MTQDKLRATADAILKKNGNNADNSVEEFVSELQNNPELFEQFARHILKNPHLMDRMDPSTKNFVLKGKEGVN